MKIEVMYSPGSGKPQQTLSAPIRDTPAPGDVLDVYGQSFRVTGIQRSMKETSVQVVRRYYVRGVGWEG